MDDRLSESAENQPQGDEWLPTPEEIWQKLQNNLAADAGQAILLVDGKQPPSLAVSNNNSVCRVLQSSPEHAHLCDPYCGQAFDHVQKAGKAVPYRCHAGFDCVAVPLAENPVRPLVAIVGRAVTKIADYQELLERANAGDWREFGSEEIFKNLLFAESARDVEALGRRLQNLSRAELNNLVEFVARTEPNPYSEIGAADDAPETAPITASIKSFASDFSQQATKSKPKRFAEVEPAETVEIESSPATEAEFLTTAQLEPEQTAEIVPEQTAAVETKKALAVEAAPLAMAASASAPQSSEIVVPRQANALSEAQNETLEDFTAWQLFTDVLLDRSFKDACAETLRFLAVRFDLQNLAWLELSHDSLKPFLVAENLRETLSRVSVPADDVRLLESALNETSYSYNGTGKYQIFPLAVGDDVRAAVLVGDKITNNERRRRIARFCRQVAVSLEVLRLREELSRRAEIVRAVQIFNEKLSSVESSAQTADANASLFDSLMQTCSELLQAERGSLLIFNEAEQRLTVEAAVGNHADALKQVSTVVGDRVAERVWRDAKPIVVENVTHVSLPPAPFDRGYRSKSFISFPLAIGNRVIGVLNVTDKKNGASYDVTDLEMLEAIAPQLAIALDRATLHQKAGRFERLSITDALTGLLNRRYLNERLAEEVKRSNRDGSPMSFLMIDIDNFKQYNDRFGHPAGDEVLKIVAQALRAVLRGADVAARFGGEEFSLLLPQTTLSEARLIAERIRERIELTDFPHRRVTVSIGVSAYSPFHNSPQEIIEAADKALYQAKRIGKNNVQLWLFGQTKR